MKRSHPNSNGRESCTCADQSVAANPEASGRPLMSKDRDLRSSLVKHETEPPIRISGLFALIRMARHYKHLTNDDHSRRLNAVSTLWLCKHTPLVCTAYVTNMHKRFPENIYRSFTQQSFIIFMEYWRGTAR